MSTKTLSVKTVSTSRRTSSAVRPIARTDIREDVVRRARERIAAGFYDSPRVLDVAIGKMVEELGKRSRRSGREAKSR